MRKLFLNFAIAVKVILSVSQLAYGGERPASAPPIDVRLTGIEKNDKRQDTELEDLKKSIDALKLAIRCPCPRGGVCICGEDCVCPNCPKHSKAAKASTAKPDYSNTVFEGNGRHALVFTATWCGPCKEAEKIRDACGLTEGVDYNLIDVDQHPEHKAKYNINSLPALVLLDGETVAHHHVGPTFQGEKIKAWMSGKPLPAGAGATLGIGKPSAPAATSDDFIPKPIAKSSPQYSYSRTGYNPVQQCSVTRLGGSRWTWPGNLGSHLSSAHGFNPAGFSHSQLVTIHDNFHNTGRSGVVRSGGYTSSAPYQTRSQPASYQFQPRVQFTSGYSYGTCPNCPR